MSVMDDHATEEDFDSNDLFVATNGVLINKLGLSTTPALNAEEIKFASLRHIQLEIDPVTGHFDLPHLQAIHRQIFQDVYPWAGEIRTVDIAKGNTIFLSHHKIKTAFEKLAGTLKNENYLTGLPPDKFAARLGDYFGKINVAHPFREGNGRTQRVFIQQLAQHAGYDLQWQSVGNDAMKNACISAEQGDASKLARLIQLNITLCRT